MSISKAKADLSTLIRDSGGWIMPHKYALLVDQRLYFTNSRPEPIDTAAGPLYQMSGTRRVRRLDDLPSFNNIYIGQDEYADILNGSRPQITHPESRAHTFLRLIEREVGYWPTQAQTANMQNDHIRFLSEEGSWVETHITTATVKERQTVRNLTITRDQWHQYQTTLCDLIDRSGGWEDGANRAQLSGTILAFKRYDDIVLSRYVGEYLTPFIKKRLDGMTTGIGNWEQYLRMYPGPNASCCVSQNTESDTQPQAGNPLLPLARQLNQLANLMRDPDTPALTLFRRAQAIGLPTRVICDALNENK